MELLNFTFIKIPIWGYPVRSLCTHGIAKLNSHKNTNVEIPSQSEVCVHMELLNGSFPK